MIRGMLQRAEQRGRWQGWGGPKALAEGATKNMSRGRRKHRDFAAGKSGMSESAQGGAGEGAGDNAQRGDGNCAAGAPKGPLSKTLNG